MNEVAIIREINNEPYRFILTDQELEQAYRLQQKRYLDEDFAIAMAEAMQDGNGRFHSGHTEEFPELTEWLCDIFDCLFDANVAHNDLIQLTLNHLNHESLTPGFFSELAVAAQAVHGGGTLRFQRFMELSAQLLTHKNGTCTCTPEKSQFCDASRYLDGELDIRGFYHTNPAGTRKEAA